MELALVLLGAIFVTYGWYWGGITEARTTAYAVGFVSVILGLTAAFQTLTAAFKTPPGVTAGSLIALGAVFGLLAAANAWNESAQDRTYGLFALFFALGAFMAVAADSTNSVDGNMTDTGLAALIVGVTLVMHFISAALVPSTKGFKAFVGWFTLGAGVALAYIGYALEAFGTSRETIRNRGERVGRNDPCPCGSGKKYKQCCMRKSTPAA